MCIPYQGAATAQANTMCSLNMLLKSPCSSLCSENSDPLFTIPASNYDTILTTPEPLACTSRVTGYVISKTIPHIRHGYIEAILCLSGEHQKLYLIQTHQKNTQIYVLQ